MPIPMRSALFLLLAATCAASAAADGYRPHRKAQQGFVVAESRLGNGTVTGAVRDAPLGPQVQLPSGTWIYCRHSCSETLRVETIDFWDAHGPNAIANESGIFGTLKITRPIE